MTIKKIEKVKDLVSINISCEESHIYGWVHANRTGGKVELRGSVSRSGRVVADIEETVWGGSSLDRANSLATSLAERLSTMATA